MFKAEEFSNKKYLKESNRVIQFLSILLFYHNKNMTEIYSIKISNLIFYFLLFLIINRVI